MSPPITRHFCIHSLRLYLRSTIGPSFAGNPPIHYRSGNNVWVRKSTPLGAQTKALLTECKNPFKTMMTYRVGACATPSAGKAMAEYYLAGTLKTQQTGAAAYYTGAATKEDRAGDFWRGAIEGHLAEGGTVAELRPDL